MKPLKLWKRMALRGKVLTIILLLLLISAIVGIGAAVYHIPLVVQNRAVQSVNALFTENDAGLAEGVAQNTGQISDSIKKAQQEQGWGFAQLSAAAHRHCPENGRCP